MKKSAIAILVILSIALISGCATQQAQPKVESTSNTVTISNFAFIPAELTIKKGTTVTWTNKDAVAHDVASKEFKSELLKKGDTFSFTFSEPREYPYQCSIHPSMKGKIKVE